MEGLSHSGRSVPGFGIGVRYVLPPPEPPERAHNPPAVYKPPHPGVGVVETYEPPPPEKAHGGGGSQPHSIPCGSPGNPCHMPGSMLFGIGTLPSSGDVFSNGLTSAQQQWVQNALTAWVSAVGNTWCGSGGAGAGLCPDISGNLVWPTALPVVTQAFQAWFNNSGTQQGGQITSNGTFDATTLAALMGLAASASWGAGVGSCPGSCGLSPSNPSNAPATTSSNTIYYVLGGAAVLALGGAAIYVARKRKRRAA